MTPLTVVSPPDTINSGGPLPSSVMSPSHILSSDCPPSPVTTVAFSGCTDVRTPISPVLSSKSLTPDISGPIVNHQSPSQSSLSTSTPYPSSVTPSSTKLSLSPFPDQNDDFDSFCRVCEDLALAVLERGKSMSNRSSGSRGAPRLASHRPNRSDPHPRRARIHNNPREARQIQILFWLSKKRAAHQILRENNVVYTGTKDQAHQHFSDSFATKHVNIDDVLESLRKHVPSTNVDPNLTTPFTNKEIKAKLVSTCAKQEISRVSNFVFQVQGHDVPCLAKEESYRYLGVPIGLIYDADDMNSTTERLIKDLEKLRDSLLAPWQKLDAIRTFIPPGLTYAFRACPVTRESLSTYRSKLIQVLRSVCRLPNRSSVSYFFASKSVGGLGLQDPFDERHVQKIVHTVKILSSADPLIHEIAHGQLKSVVYRCIHRNPSDGEIDNFLSGSNEGGLNNHSSANNSQTLWSCCQIPAKALHVTFSNALTDPSVSVNDNSFSEAKSVAAYLHRACLEKHSDILKSLPDQGKVARCLQTSQFPSTKNWSYDGTGLRFCDWRFIHRACTNTLPTNDVKSRFSGGHSPTCRKCQSLGDNETLPHIVCHCPPNMPSITRRHNAILERLSKTIHRGSRVLLAIIALIWSLRMVIKLLSSTSRVPLTMVMKR